MSAPRWLSDEQQADWRAWIASSMLLRDQLNRDLQEQHGLTMADYEILVELSEHPERRLRMSELAVSTLVSRSRLSHQIDRMEKAGLVVRQECTDDRRGFFAALTDKGMRAIEKAAPDHVESVRTYLLDQMSEEEFHNFGEACRKILDGLQGEQE
jgi:DNA-binding MarR family transcriptional regulator